MKDISKKQQFKKTQSTSSPGALGEDANRNDRQVKQSVTKENKKTSKEEGLNQQNSPGNAGAFEGLENADDSGK